MKNLTRFFDSLKKICSTPQQAMDTEYIKEKFFKITGNKISEKDEIVAVILIFEKILDSKLAVREETLAKKTKEELTQAIINIANDQIKRRNTRLDRVIIAIITITLLLSIISICIIPKISYDAGYSRGFGMGYSESKDEKAAAAWANTHQGRQAYSLAQVGDIDTLIKCNNNGWAISKDKGNGKKLCTPFSVPGQGTIGWYIP